MKKILTAAQIGCGKFAWSQDLPNMTGHPDVRLKWVCDIKLEQARKTAEHFRVPHATDDFMEIVGDPEVDFIKIATSHEAHLPIIEAAAKAGKHIFCEKPMAMSDREAWLIMRAVRRNGVKLCVDLNRPEMACPCGKSGAQSVALRGNAAGKSSGGKSAASADPCAG